MVSRRRILEIGGTGVVVFVAGCSGSNGDDGQPTQDQETTEETGDGEEPQENQEDDGVEDGDGVVIVPEEHPHREEITLADRQTTVTYDNFQELNTNHPIFQNTDHTDNPEREIGYDTAPRIWHQERIENLRRHESTEEIREIKEKLYNRNVPEEIENTPVFADYKDATQDELVWLDEIDYDLFLDAESEKTALGIVHPLVWNTEYHISEEAVNPLHGNPFRQMYAIETMINEHPNNDLEIRITPMEVNNNTRGLAYSKNDDKIRLIETNSESQASTPNDPQRSPLIEESNYLDDSGAEYNVDAALERETDFDHEQIDEISSELEKVKMMKQVYNLSRDDEHAPETNFDEGRSFHPAGRNAWTDGRVAMPPGILTDLRQSILEYNTGNNVDFEEDIVTLATLTDTVEVQSEQGEHYIIDYAPGNNYNGELNGDYMVDKVDRQTFQNVKTDLEGQTNHFFESGS